jgi:hypothetical protein
MTWWAWTLVFVVLVVGAALLGLVQLRTLWRKISALLSELGAAVGQLGQLSDRLAELEQLAPARPTSSVFDDPAVLRRRRDRDIADRVRRGRTAARRQTPR